MKLAILKLFLLLLPVWVNAQNRRQIDSAFLLLEHATNDTIRMRAYSMLGSYYDDVNADSGLYFCNKGIAIAEKLDLPLNKAEMLAFMGWPLMKTGNYPEALRVINQGLKIAEDPANGIKTTNLKAGQTPKTYRLGVIALLYTALESLYLYVGNYDKQLEVAREAIIQLEAAGDLFNLAGIYPDIGDSYLKLDKIDSAIFYQQKSLDIYAKLPFEARKFEGSTYTSLGTIYEKIGDIDRARESYQTAIRISEQHDNPRHTGNASLQLVTLYQSLQKPDSAFIYAQKALEAFRQGGYKKEVAIAYRMIADYYYDKKNTDSSFAYLRLATVLDDSLDKIEKTKLQEFQVAAFNQQLALQQQEQERVEKEGKLKSMAIIALIVVFSSIGFLLYRNNRLKQKTNQALQEKNNQIEQTLSDLKATQKQLIQSEKMASLGELTAGIAHEIQNPLNFVNNFSEVNSELIEEVKIQKSKVKNEELDDLLDDILMNNEKILQHGKRADAIVKGMLQHSQKGSGVKEPTNINALADEYLRLAYHTLKAKDKSFNANFKTDFDQSIGLINVIPQDIGRVLLNLINNAFYAVNEKKKQIGDGYEPEVTVSTRMDTTSKNSPISQLANSLIISVKDNGKGIPEGIRNKIFQPFFTTKPTGEGTGLGLSLSYDIVKAHGGEIRVESKEGMGSIFTVIL